jgi:hypothetical protein
MTSKCKNFCEEFLRRAEKYADAYGTVSEIKFGTKSISLGCNEKSYFGELVSSAFLQGEVPTLKSDFVLYVWDSSFPDLLPDFTWAEDYIFSNQVIDYQVTKPYRVLFDRGQGMISVFNTESNIGGIWMRDHSQLDPRCFVAPFRTILSWIAESFSAEVIHASGIVVNGSGILISGPSGSGKSSLALFAALEGYGIISDDAVLYENGYLYPIYRRAKVEKHNNILDTSKLDTFELRNSPSGKNLLDLECFGDKFVKKTPLKCFVFSSIGSDSEFCEISSADASILLIDQSLRELFGGLPTNRIRLALLLKKYASFKQVLSGDIRQDFQSLIAQTESIKL